MATMGPGCERSGNCSDSTSWRRAEMSCVTCRGCSGGIKRRDFFTGLGATAAGLALSGRAASQSRDPVHQSPIRTPLRVQPALLYSTPQRRDRTSWREWGGIQTEQEAGEERNRIQKELDALRRDAGFPLEILPIASVK